MTFSAFCARCRKKVKKAERIIRYFDMFAGVGGFRAGLDCRAMPVVFLGGGAGLMKRYLPQGSVLRPVILDDDKLNAQAYERLAGQVAGHAG